MVWIWLVRHEFNRFSRERKRVAKLHMSKALRFGKSVHDNGWGMFIMFLHYKLREAGKQLVKVDKWFLSSKTCSVCGRKKDELALSERICICECGNIMDRDQNAAINIRQEGLRKLGIA